MPRLGVAQRQPGATKRLGRQAGRPAALRRFAADTKHTAHLIRHPGARVSPAIAASLAPPHWHRLPRLQVKLLRPSGAFRCAKVQCALAGARARERSAAVQRADLVSGGLTEPVGSTRLQRMPNIVVNKRPETCDIIEVGYFGNILKCSHLLEAFIEPRSKVRI